ncbi:MAG: molybdopterin-dependent oxidoreductase [Gammaproteobacteria bacterium]|nr:molybdopterin-dependent oxidoreductase [Gammaproteobacteria bacterium]
MIGQSVERLEDAALLRGLGRFIDDLREDGQLYAICVRSSQAHARIVHIDTADAVKAPGVVEVLTSSDLQADGLGFIQDTCALKSVDGSAFINPPRPALAAGKVRFVGDIIALVVATSANAARDGAELIDIELASLDAVVNVQGALADGAPQLWEEAPGNLALDWAGGDAAATQQAFASAAHVTRLRLVNNRIVVAAMETRGVIASYDAGRDHYTLYTPSQGVNHIRMPLAAVGLRTSPANVRVVTPDVGGAFGMKIPLYPEHILIAWAARRSGRAVKWIAERSDAFIADGHGRDHIMEAELALDEDGRFLAVRVHTLSNMGAYANGAAPVIPTVGGTRCITGVYRIPAWYARTQVVFSNTVPVVAYRGAGKPEYNYVIERLTDAAARELGLSPLELRRRNAVAQSAMPYSTGTGLEFDSGDFIGNMERALELAEHGSFAARREAAKAQGKLRGLGLALYQEPDGYMDNRVSLAFDQSGLLTVSLTGDDAGQGHRTTFAQIAAAQFAIPLERVDVQQGDSAIVGAGSGTGGSRTTTVAGVGIVTAARQIIDKGRQLAGQLLEASPLDVTFEDGGYVIAGTDRKVSFDNVIGAAFDARALPAEAEPGLSAQCHHLARAYNYPCGCHVCEVEIDVDTGEVTLAGYWMVSDHGVLINPRLLEGQLHGGTVQGIGQALLEHCCFDDSGQLLSGSFMDYCLPRATDITDLVFEHRGIACRTNPLGVKGVGESGCTASMPAIMNAIVDALAERGITHVDMPATPARIWELLHH